MKSLTGNRSLAPASVSFVFLRLQIYNLLINLFVPCQPFFQPFINRTVSRIFTPNLNFLPGRWRSSGYRFENTLQIFAKHPVVRVVFHDCFVFFQRGGIYTVKIQRSFFLPLFSSSLQAFLLDTFTSARPSFTV